MHHIMIATPAYGNVVSVNFMESVVRLSGVRQDVRVSIKTISNESLITRARNHIVADFMAEESLTHLLFIDADIGFEPEAVFDLVDSGYPVCACPYPLKKYKFEGGSEEDNMSYVLNFGLSDLQLPVMKGKFVEVMETGTGFMMITRDAIDIMQRRYPELVYGYKDGVAHALFDTMIEPGTRRYLSEDYAFCRRWRDAGGSIMLCVVHNLNHTGTHTFRGNFLNSIRKEAPNAVKEEKPRIQELD